MTIDPQNASQNGVTIAAFPNNRMCSSRPRRRTPNLADDRHVSPAAPRDQDTDTAKVS